MTDTSPSPYTKWPESLVRAPVAQSRLLCAPGARSSLLRTHVAASVRWGHDTDASTCSEPVLPCCPPSPVVQVGAPKSMPLVHGVPEFMPAAYRFGDVLFTSDFTMPFLHLIYGRC